jgi:hypothetical protein
MTRPRNVPASVRARLLNIAKAENRPFQEVLQYYAMERFLYRLSRSDQATLFVLKGALMLQLWGGGFGRATKDIDLLRASTCSVADIVVAVKRLLAAEVEDDGLRFDLDAVSGEEIRLDAIYNGVRARALCFLDGARIRLQIDVGFGDAVTPEAQPIVYPTLLDFQAPELLGYTPETAIAEKLHAMVALDMANTRLKDFYDVWALSGALGFDGPTLGAAIRATFERRQTALPESRPIALTPSFYAAPIKQAQWRAYLKKNRVADPMPRFDDVAETIADFLMPLIAALNNHENAFGQWPPGGPWEP